MTNKNENSVDQDLLLNHEYDGIQEYDNPMPRWWVWMFWGSFYFSLGYFIHFHITENGDSVQESYEASMAQAREAEAMMALGGGVKEEALQTLMENEAMMGDAKGLFEQRCAQCHGLAGEGLIGPNLTDDYWLNGDASLMSIYDLISDGVTSKGMPAWKRQLRPMELSKLAAYIGSLRGTDVPGPKGQEGRLIAIAGSSSGELVPPTN